MFSGSWRNTFGARTSTERSSGVIRLRPTGLTFPVIFNSYRVILNEKVQVLESFKEVVHVFAFGKGAGQAVLTGFVLAHGTRNPSHRRLNSRLMRKYEKGLRAFKTAKAGRVVTISGPGDMILRGVAVGLEISLSAETQGFASFSLRFILTSSAQGI